MKLIRANKRGFTFRFELHEKKLFLELLNLYPLVPETHHQLSKEFDMPEPDENQRLLEEALTEQRKVNRREILDLINKRRRFRKKNKTCYEITFQRPEIEWLLQVINDIRVGSWIALGEPDDDTPPKITIETAMPFFRLQLCGVFQYTFLEALGVTTSPEWIADA